MPEYIVERTEEGWQVLKGEIAAASFVGWRSEGRARQYARDRNEGESRRSIRERFRHQR
jgi:hypothetical protein